METTNPAPPPQLAEEALAPLPSNTRTIFLGGIFVLVFLTCIHSASEIVIPIVFAFVLKLVMQPVFRMLTKIYINNAFKPCRFMGRKNTR